ncbi:MAG: sigma-70 family RNA polymerase sigma factor [Anaerolineae bacterium]|nr:sigma-70 family RNA polymerase sigma factor [Anaerolineae bacterium]
MSTDTLPAEPDWLVRGRMAAYCARRRMNLDTTDLTPQDMEDLIQVARVAYWKHLRDGRPAAFCFACARNAAQNYFRRQIRGRNPRFPFSLDAPLHDGGSPPEEWLPAASTAAEEPLRLDWLSDGVLEGVLYEARQAAGFSQRDLTRTRDTLQTDKRIIRLAARGHTNASIAELLGTTEGTVRNRRHRIRRLLEHLLPPDLLPVEYSRTGGNQQMAHEIRMTYPDQKKPSKS